MENLEYLAIYDDVNEELEEEIIQFWSKHGNLPVKTTESQFNQIVIVILDTDSVIKLNQYHTIDKYGNMLDIHGTKIVVEEIIGFSYVDRHYLENNELYYFYNYFIPNETYNNDEVKFKLYESTKQYLCSLKYVDNYVDRGNYLGLILQKYDKNITDKFNFECCDFKTDSYDFCYYKCDNYWLDKFDEV
jgi:hypothetical protein